jgi:hypothetical protein
MFNINLNDIVHFKDIDDPNLILDGIISVISIQKISGETVYGIELLNQSGVKVTKYLVSSFLVTPALVYNCWDPHPSSTITYINNVVGKKLYLWIDQKDIISVISPATYVGAFSTSTNILQGFTVGATKPIEIVVNVDTPSEIPQIDDDAGLKYL